MVTYGLFRKTSLLSQTCCGLFWAIFGKLCDARNAFIGPRWMDGAFYIQAMFTFFFLSLSFFSIAGYQYNHQHKHQLGQKLLGVKSEKNGKSWEGTNQI